jgi:hypothetical protein
MPTGVKPKDILSLVFIKFFNEHEDKVFTIDIQKSLLQFFKSLQDAPLNSNISSLLPSPDSNPKLYSYLSTLISEIGLDTPSSNKTSLAIQKTFIQSAPLCFSIFSKLLPAILSSAIDPDRRNEPPTIRSTFEKPGDVIPLLQILFYSLISKTPVYFEQISLYIEHLSLETSKTTIWLDNYIKKEKLQNPRTDKTKILELLLRNSLSRTSFETRQLDEKKRLFTDIIILLRPLVGTS